MSKTYFFCGVGGSGMSALAVIFAQKDFTVLGSDRSRDSGQSPEKFKALEKQGIQLFPQNGSGITAKVDALIVSSAVEDSIPDVKAAKAQGIQIRKRAELLAEIFNQSRIGISIAGTSGKTTVTGMIAVMLKGAGLDPTVMNGGMMVNFMNGRHEGLANMRTGEGDVFVTETDESDGSIALYNPAVAVLNNVALDHKSMEELDSLFGDFIARASRGVILNFDDARAKAFKARAKVPVVGYSLTDAAADFFAKDIQLKSDGVSFAVYKNGKEYPVELQVPGAHNVSNALAALAVAQVLDIPIKKAIKSLEDFKGIKRRLEVVGSRNDITVIDDFAHNPDKISATLKTLKAFPGRLIIMFQPHGFGPLKLMGRQMADVFIKYLDPDDILLMPEAYYAGGTADRSVTAKHVVDMVKKGGGTAQWFEKRRDILPFIDEEIRKDDRVIIMGARDDTLSDFAEEILNGI